MKFANALKLERKVSSQREKKINAIFKITKAPL